MFSAIYGIIEISYCVKGAFVMTRKTRKIIFFSVMALIVAALTVSIVLLVNHITRNPLEGTWVSASDSGSYVFHEDGSVKVYYPGDKLPILETPYKGSIDGTYAYDKSEKLLSITFNIYSKEITSHYTFDIEDSTLTLTEAGTQKEKTYNYLVVEN